MFKKIVLSVAAMTLMASAGTKIFLDYEYGTPKSEIKDLKLVKNQSIFPKSSKLKVYEDPNNQFFAFLNGKLHTVFVMYKDYDVKKEIEKILKNGFRLKKIVYRDKFGVVPVANVGELLKKIKAEREKALFDSIFEADLLFENDSGARVVMNIREVKHFGPGECPKCDYLNGEPSQEYHVMTIFFTKAQ